MDNKLPKRSFRTKRVKSLYKPYWSEELDVKWDAVRTCERKWLRCNGTHAEKRRLQALYVTERRQLEKMNKRTKRKYQSDEQQRLLDLHTGHNTRDFWRAIWKLGIQNELSRRIPMEAVDPQGEISSDTNTVISRWKNDFELFSQTLIILHMTTGIWKILNAI